MKKHILLPLLALAGGSAGLVLHRWELSLAADTATGLLNSGQPATAVLAVLAIALAAALALLCRGGSAPKDWRDGLRCPLSGWVALMVAAALLLLACGGLTVSSAIQRLALWRMDPDRNTLPIMDGLLALSCLPAALAVLKLGQGGYRGSLTQEDRWMTALPGYAAVFWAVSTYQQNAISPYPMQYAWATLSCVCLLLAFYFFAAGAFGARLSGLFPLFALIGIVLDLHRHGRSGSDPAGTFTAHGLSSDRFGPCLSRPATPGPAPPGRRRSWPAACGSGTRRTPAKRPMNDRPPWHHR